MRSAGLRAPQAIALLVIALLTVAMSWFLLGLATTVLDIAPDGPACRYDVSGGSGPVRNDGREETAWGLMPTKQCAGSVGGVRVVDDSHADGLEVLAIPVGIAVGVAVWWTVRRRLLHRDAGADQS